jgi:hypothetical protein
MTMIKSPPNPQASLKRRIRQFYGLLNRHEFTRCHHVIDPRIRNNPRSVARFQYESSVGEFVEQVGAIRVLDIRVEPHLNEPSALYEGRDFAVGHTLSEWRVANAQAALSD